MSSSLQEDPKHTLYFAHWFFADHIFSTSWTVFFAVVYWFQTPHDGELQINSDAQLQIIKATPTVGHVYTQEERLQAAMEIWKRENGTAFAIIVLSWLSKVWLSPSHPISASHSFQQFYFALLIYSYATHLRKGSYRSLPRTRHAAGASVSSNHTYDPSLGFPDEEDEEIEDFYRVPLRTPNTGGSVASFADFVNAPPGRARRTKSASGRSALGKPDDVERDVEEVLFDDEELMSQGHSKLGTDESSATSTTDDDRVNRGVRV